MKENDFCDGCTDKEHCPEYKSGDVCVNDRKKMSKNELTAALTAILSAKEIIGYLANENYPYSNFKDSDLETMFYILNDMSLMLFDKINALKAETV